MKTFRHIATLLLGALASTAACAADNDSSPWQSRSWQAPAWQGFYAGINAGVAWGHDDISQSTTGGAATGFTPSMNTYGGEEGFHAGYNYVFNSVLLGADADFDYSGADGGYRVIANGSGQDQKFEWLSSARARMGLPLGNWLPFITGGVAFSNIKDSYVDSSGLTEDKSDVRTGWTAGAGLEYAMPENFTFRVDYRYYDFGSYTDTPSGAFPGLRYKQEPTLNSVTAGVSYNFR